MDAVLTPEFVDNFWNNVPSNATHLDFARAISREVVAILAKDAGLTDAQIASAWRQWPKTSITSAAKAIEFMRWCGISTPAASGIGESGGEG